MSNTPPRGGSTTLLYSTIPGSADGVAGEPGELCSGGDPAGLPVCRLCCGRCLLPLLGLEEKCFWSYRWGLWNAREEMTTGPCRPGDGDAISLAYGEGVASDEGAALARGKYGLRTNVLLAAWFIMDCGGEPVLLLWTADDGRLRSPPRPNAELPKLFARGSDSGGEAGGDELLNSAALYGS